MRDPALLLERLLDEERALLLSGRLTEVASLADRKAQLLSDLPGSPRGAPQYRRLRTAAQRTLDLLAAAAAGLRDARARLTELRQSAGTLATYSPEGARLTVSTGRGGVERRA
jgi:flagellar biosynthesis/type III secretory pathway chaperone